MSASAVEIEYASWNHEERSTAGCASVAAKGTLLGTTRGNFERADVVSASRWFI
jgi:hypothetical protein